VNAFGHYLMPGNGIFHHDQRIEVPQGCSSNSHPTSPVLRPLRDVMVALWTPMNPFPSSWMKEESAFC
jgi:hypothetical protein